MVFNSYIFILLFLPVVVLLYFILCKYEKNNGLGKLFLLASSLLFLSYTNIFSAVILAVSIIVNYILNKIIKKSNKKIVLSITIIFNVLLLCAFKYAGLLSPKVSLIFPVGISFYTFQQIAFAVDNYRGQIKDFSLLDYSLFNAYFPKLVQGPIAYYSEIVPQFNSKDNKRFNYENFAKGLFIFSVGLAKKVLVADTLAKIPDYCYNTISSLTSFEAILAIIAYTLQLYFDFSGYCDMAVGVSDMLNINLPINFNSPYKSLDISDFWKRWHITLTRFLTKYIYIPLGGNRKGKIRTYINIIIIFLISGLWHGAGLTFVVWGLMHGVATVLYRLVKSKYDKIPKIIRWIVNFIFINITWVFFRAASLTNGINMIKQVFIGGGSFSINPELTELMLQPVLISVPSQFIPFSAVILIYTVMLVLGCVFIKNSNIQKNEFKPNVLTWLVTAVLLLLGIFSVSGVSTFLYTNF